MAVVRFQVVVLSAAFALCTAMGNPALAQKSYDSGASDTEIKIGNIMPYSGPASAYAVIGKAEEAYFNKVNAEGGVFPQQEKKCIDQCHRGHHCCYNGR